jgi:hypothetical protein
MALSGKWISIMFTNHDYAITVADSHGASLATLPATMPADRPRVRRSAGSRKRSTVAPTVATVAPTVAPIDAWRARLAAMQPATVAPTVAPTVAADSNDTGFNAYVVRGFRAAARKQRNLAKATADGTIKRKHQSAARKLISRANAYLDLHGLPHDFKA